MHTVQFDIEIRNALQAVDRLLAALPSATKDADSGQGSLIEPGDDASVEAEEALHEADRQRAIRCCLMSSAGLLAMTRTLMHRRAGQTAQEREREQHALSAIAKAAGRSIYQAGLHAIAPRFSSGRQDPDASHHYLDGESQRA